MKKALVMILLVLMSLAMFAPMVQAQFGTEIIQATSWFDLTWPTPQNSMWVEQSPNPGLVYHLLFWTDNGDGKLSASDQITMYYYYGWYDYHVDWIQDLGDPGWTMQITYKTAPVPEFPLGMIMPLAIAVAIGYLGFRKRKAKPLK